MFEYYIIFLQCNSEWLDKRLRCRRLSDNEQSHLAARLHAVVLRGRFVEQHAKLRNRLGPESSAAAPSSRRFVARF